MSTGRQSAISDPLGSNIRVAFRERAVREVTRLSNELDESALLQALTMPTDAATVAEGLSRLESFVTSDPLMAARLRGANRKRQLIEGHGGALTGAQAAGLLGITRQAVDKRRQQGKLIAVELDKKGYCYPAWQFPLLDWIEPVLTHEFKNCADPWVKLSFFLNPHGLLEGKTPLVYLQKQHGRGHAEDTVSAVRTAARAYLEAD